MSIRPAFRKPIANPSPMPGAEDAGLMAAVGAGQQRAFAELYDRLADRAYLVAYMMCGDAVAAETAVRDGFLSIWRDPTRPGGCLRDVAAELLSVVCFRAADLAQADGRTRDDRLALLPDSQRAVIVLAHHGELSCPEISAHLGLTTGTVKAYMRTGLERLQTDSGIR